MHKRVSCGDLHSFLLHNLENRFVVDFALTVALFSFLKVRDCCWFCIEAHILCCLLFCGGDDCVCPIQFYVDTVKQMALHQLVAGSPLRTLCLLIAGQPAEVFSSDTMTDSNLPGAVKMPQQSAQVRY